MFHVEDLPEGTLVADGWDEALIGYGWRLSTPIAVYDKDKAIEIGMRHGGTEEEVEEYISFNVEGAYVGEGTPLFVTLDCGVDHRELALIEKMGAPERDAMRPLEVAPGAHASTASGYHRYGCRALGCV